VFQCSREQFSKIGEKSFAPKRLRELPGLPQDADKYFLINIFQTSGWNINNEIKWLHMIIFCISISYQSI
jgi:hypothetical protein